MFDQVASSADQQAANGNAPAKSSVPRPVLITGGVLGLVLAVLILIHITGLHTFLFFTSRHLLIVLGLLSVAGVIASGILYRNNVADDAEAVIPATVVLNIIIFISVGLVAVSICTVNGACSWTASIIWSLAMLASGGAVGFLFGIPRNRTGKSLMPSSAPRQSSPLAPVAKDKQNTAIPDAANQVVLPVAVIALNTEPPPTAATTDPAIVVAPQDNGQPPVPPTINPPPSGTQQDPPSSTDSPGSETAIEQISDWLTKIIVGVGLTNLKQIPTQLDRLGWYVGRSIDQTNPNQFLAVGIVIYFSVLGVITGYLITQLFLHKLVNRP